MNMKPTDLLKYLRGESSCKEKEQLAAWLDASAENRKEFNDIRFIFEATKIHGAELRRQLEIRPRKSLRANYHIAVGRMLRVAAAVLLLVGGGYFIHTRTYDSVSSQMTALDVPAGQRIEATLPDGSRVWLNSGTHIEYPAVFGRHERKVRFSGEALFDVRHDADRPFIVQTFVSDVEVLGTRFNVSADAASQRFSTTLLEGRVKVSHRNGGECVVLQPNDQVMLVEGRFRVDTISDLDAVCWTEGLISVQRLSFAELMAKFEKAYAVKIKIARTTMPLVGFESGKIRISDGIDHALRVLQHESDFTFVHDVKSNQITIY